MENTAMITHETEMPAATFTKVIDGRIFVVRAFFPTENAEPMQNKIERMLHKDIMNAIHQSAA